jgi:predicted RNase H-like nuclease (RuvC/YqgF family)
VNVFQQQLGVAVIFCLDVQKLLYPRIRTQQDIERANDRLKHAIDLASSDKQQLERLRHTLSEQLDELSTENQRLQSANAELQRSRDQLEDEKEEMYREQERQNKERERRLFLHLFHIIAQQKFC